MAKDMHLVNIYLKIHNKRPITMDDLRYLAKYSPECFEKTCKNVIYNRPETKPVMTPTVPATSDSLWNPPAIVPEAPATSTSIDLRTTTTMVPSEQENITQILANLTQLESGAFPITHMDADEVKDLLGNLYMELLFPHNDRDTFFDMSQETTSRFDRRA